MITDLQPAFFANDVGRAFAINTPGEVVGWVYSRLQAFRWTPTGVMVPLDGGLPFGINDAGCVAGWGATGGGRRVGWSWGIAPAQEFPVTWATAVQ